MTLPHAPSDLTETIAATAMSPGRLSVRFRLHRHSDIAMSTPQEPISRRDVVGQHCDRPPDCPACAIFFLRQTETLVGPGLWSVQR
jgi:hypothetical protein